LGNDSIWDHACDFTIGLEEIEKDALFNLYPNPSTGILNVSYQLNKDSENHCIIIYDAVGKIRKSIPFSEDAQGHITIDCSGFPNGFYTCVLVTDKKVVGNKKLVLIK
jgi:hypothetical protein